MLGNSLMGTPYDGSHTECPAARVFLSMSLRHSTITFEVRKSMENRQVKSSSQSLENRLLRFSSGFQSNGTPQRRETGALYCIIWPKKKKKKNISSRGAITIVKM
jgi:hypothetical protein